MAVGIIAEFNPFHNGHKYLIERAKLRGGAVVAVTSGAWVQRGGIAITDKLTRARQALSNGVDLVLELPVIYSMNTAQKFARGAVAILAACGVVDTLVFGSESGSKADITKAAELICNEPNEVSDKIQALSATGMSYAAARAAAYESLLSAPVPSAPNDILAVEYASANMFFGCGMELCPIKRIGSAHDSREISDGIASASEIRRRILDGKSAARYLPCPDFPVYDETRLDVSLIAKLRSCGAEYLRDINDVSEGLENRFIKAAAECDNVQSLCAAVKSKRYTLSRIRRIAWSALLGMTKELAAAPPAYIRVLGMTDGGKALLKQMKSAASLPIVTKPTDFKNDAVFDFNSRCEDIFALAAPSAALRRGGSDLRATPVTV